MKLQSLIRLIMIIVSAVMFLPFIAHCQEFDSASWNHFKTIEELKQVGGGGATTSISYLDSIPITRTSGLTINQSAKYALRQPPQILSIISGKSRIDFSLTGDTMTAKLTGSMDSVAQSFIDCVLLQYNQELWKLRDFKKIAEEQAKGSASKLILSDSFTPSGVTTIPPSPGYRESWSLVKGKWTQKEDGHFWLMWFDNGQHTSIWVQNYDMKDERFEAMADFISSYGAGDYFWADCCTISTDMKTNISTKSSFNINIVDKRSQENPAYFSTKNATKEDIETVKQRIIEFFITNK